MNDNAVYLIHRVACIASKLGSHRDLCCYIERFSFSGIKPDPNTAGNIPARKSLPLGC